jgi:hypothetical protein
MNSTIHSLHRHPAPIQLRAIRRNFYLQRIAMRRPRDCRTNAIARPLRHNSARRKWAKLDLVLRSFH